MNEQRVPNASVEFDSPEEAEEPSLQATQPALKIVRVPRLQGAITALETALEETVTSTLEFTHATKLPSSTEAAEQEVASNKEQVQPAKTHQLAMPSIFLLVLVIAILSLFGMSLKWILALLLLLLVVGFLYVLVVAAAG